MPRRLRVLAGPTPDNLVPITDIVNTGLAYSITSEHFEGRISIYVKNFIDPKGRRLTSEYFEREDRKGITWSIQVQGMCWGHTVHLFPDVFDTVGRFLQSHSADDILFGNIFEKRLKLPWGSGAALKFMQCVHFSSKPLNLNDIHQTNSFIDPTLEHNLISNKPWALSPLIATMPHFMHERIYELDGLPQSDFPSFPPLISISDDTSQLWTTSTCAVSQSRSCFTTPPAPSRTSFSTSWSSNSDTSRNSKLSFVNNRLKRSLERAHVLRIGTTNDMDFRTASERRSFFSSTQHRREVVLGPQVCASGMEEEQTDDG